MLGPSLSRLLVGSRSLDFAQNMRVGHVQTIDKSAVSFPREFVKIILQYQRADLGVRKTAPSIFLFSKSD